MKKAITKRVEEVSFSWGFHGLKLGHMVTMIIMIFLLSLRNKILYILESFNETPQNAANLPFPGRHTHPIYSLGDILKLRQLK